MEKKEIRNWVQETVENIFKGEIEEAIKHNIKISLDYDDEEGFWDSEIFVYHLYNGKWEICNWFYFPRYYNSHWEMVTQPWVCEMVTDITNVVVRFIEEPKKKGC